MTSAFYVFLLLPSFAFAFASLAALYGARRAYIALSWIPVTFFMLIYVLRQLSAYQPPSVDWQAILSAVGWTALIQCLLGAALAARAARRRQSYTGLLIACCVAGIPYLLRA